MKTPPVPPRLKPLLTNVGLAAGSLLFAFVLAEIGLRLYLYGGITWKYSHLPPLVHEPDPASGWRLSPNQEAARATLEYELVIHTNSQGLRGPERPAEPAPGEFTILLLGDSYMEAAHVEEAQSFAHVLEASLGRGYRVINLGVGGYSTVQAWREFEVRGGAYQPDLVLLAFYAENDVYGNSAELSARMWGEDDPRFYSAPFATFDDGGGLAVMPPQYERAREAFEASLARYNPTLHWLAALKKSAVERVYKQAASQFRQKIHRPGDDVAIHLGVYAAEYANAADAAAWEEAFKVTAAVLSRMRGSAGQAGAQFAVFAVPSKLQSQPNYGEAVRDRHPEMTLDFDRPHRWLEDVCREADIPWRDLLPDFRAAKAEGATLSYTAGDSHWNPDGHAFAAALVAQWLRDSNLLERASP